MQFAGGRTIAQLSAEWEQPAEWVEEAIRLALRETIPQREGGSKAPRAQTRATARLEARELEESQCTLGW